MALIRCPECDGKVSQNAETCPHCGKKLSPMASPGYGRFLLIAGVVILTTYQCTKNQNDPGSRLLRCPLRHPVKSKHEQRAPVWNCWRDAAQTWRT